MYAQSFLPYKSPFEKVDFWVVSYRLTEFRVRLAN